jgi:hypothetical protein
MAFCSGAAAQVTVGQVAPTSSPFGFCGGPYDEWQTSVASGASYAVPAPGGAITSWSTVAAVEPGQKLTLKVLRPSGLGFTVVGHDGPRPLTSGVLNTFTTSIPVQVGDLLAMHMGTLAESSFVACTFETGLLGDVIGYRESDVTEGGLLTAEETYPEERLNISATVLPPPTISSLGTAGGSIKGGASVVVAGTNFASVSAVNFGSVAATSFTVNSEGQITAIAPASKTLSKVPVSVTTAAGTASSASTFTYEGCKVPKLGGVKLKGVKKKAKKADCKVGQVKKLGDATAKTGKVTKQNPKAGKILPPGAKVNVTLR